MQRMCQCDVYRVSLRYATVYVDTGVIGAEHICVPNKRHLVLQWDTRPARESPRRTSTSGLYQEIQEVIELVVSSREVG